MKITYVANHGQKVSNDDEGAIAHALRTLGHEVRCMPEEYGRAIEHYLPCDLLLMHKWDEWRVLEKLKGRTKRAFWYFDLVDHPDPLIKARCMVRKAWMERAMQCSDFGFCSDGDWVDRHRGRLQVLTQGADQRIVGAGIPGPVVHPILFTGISRGGGEGRERFVREMRDRWGGMFHHVERGVHGRELANLVASSIVVVAPNSPVTDRYCSNRATLILGFGGFLLHPKCGSLSAHYHDGEDFVPYSSMDELHRLIETWMKAPPRERAAVRASALAKTQKRNTYLHRCEELMEIVR